MGDVKFCIRCGKPIQKEDVFCPYCGNKIIQPKSSVKEQTPNISNLSSDSINNGSNEKTVGIDQNSARKGLNAVKDAAASTVKSVYSGAQDAIGNFSKKSEEHKPAPSEIVNEIIDKQKPGIQTQEKKERLHDASEDISTTELWTWLKQSSKRQHFYVDKVSVTKADVYFKTLSAKLKQNSVPAVIKKRNIQWDHSDVYKEDYEILPKTEEVNPLSCLVQFNCVGKFAFVEEKIFITPPELPKPPMAKKPINESLERLSISFAVIGLIMMIMGIRLSAAYSYYNSDLSMGNTLLLFGIVGLLIGLVGLSTIGQTRDHNRKCEAMQKAWNDAWDTWENNIFLHSFQEDINGQVSRVYDAAFECIKQVNEELFNVTDYDELTDSTKLSELEEMIARRRQEYR